MVSCVVNSRPHPRRTSQSRPRDESLQSRRNSPVFSSACALFHFPYALSPFLATLAKTAGVYTNNSHSGTHRLTNLPSSISLACANLIPRSVCCYGPLWNGSPTPHNCLKSFRNNTYASPRKCCKQKTYTPAKSFTCNTYTKRGDGAWLWLTRNPISIASRCGRSGRKSACPSPVAPLATFPQTTFPQVAALPSGCYDLVFHDPH